MAQSYLNKTGLTYFWNKLKSFFVKGNGRVFYGTCATAAATTAKEVTCSSFTSSDLVAGTIISVLFTNTNSGAVDSITLNVNSTGAKNIKYIYNGSISNIPVAGYIKANQLYQFTYDGTYWVVQMIYNTNTVPYYLIHTNYILAKTAITAESVIVGDASGYSRVASGVTFDITYPIIWCTTAVAAAGANYGSMFLCHYDRNIATGAKSGFTSTKNKLIYLVVTISGSTATIDSTIITDTLPSSDDGKVYIVLGRMGNNSTGANYFIFYPDHPMYWYKGGAIRPYGAQAVDSALSSSSTNPVQNNVINTALSGKVPTTRTVNGMALSSDITLDASDIEGTVPGDSGTYSVQDIINNINFDAEENQNAFSKVKVGSTTVEADSKTDTLELVAGTGITLTPDATNDSITIASSGGSGSSDPTTWYGTSSTAASTAAKVVTCADFTLTKGALIGVLFTTANTAATPTLNVNSTGAKSIYIGSATPNATTNVLKWSANTMIYFMYDGTYFRYLHSVSAGNVQSSRGAGTWYGASSTTAVTTAKISTIANFVLTPGALVSILFSNANTAEALTLNINSTGAKTICKGNSATSSTNLLTWNAGDVVTFIYNGTNYYVVSVHGGNSGAVSADYIVEQNVGDATGGYTKWNSGKLEIWKRQTTTVNVTSAMAGGLYYGTISAIDYPVAFSHYPTVSITAQVSDGFGWLIPTYNDYSVTNTGTLYIYYVASKSSVSVTLNIYAVGRWK